MNMSTEKLEPKIIVEKQISKNIIAIIEEKNTKNNKEEQTKVRALAKAVESGNLTFISAMEDII